MSVRVLAKAGFIYLFILIPVFVFAQQTRIYDHPEASYRLGLDLIGKKQYGAALEVFHALLDELPAGESVMRLDAQYYDALCDYKLDHPEAKQKFLQFIRYYPDHSKTNQAYLHLGFIEYSTRKYKDALKSFQEVDPFLLPPGQLSEYLYKTGYCYLQQDEYDKAKEALFPILNTESDFKDAANYYYAHIAYIEQDYDEALKYFSRLDMDSEFGQEVPFYLLQINYINQNYTEITRIGPELVDEKIKDKKKKAEAARIVAEAFFINNDFENALVYFDIYQANSRKGLSREENYQLAYAYYQTRNYEKAIEGFQKVTKEKDEMSQNAYYHLADCYLKSDEKKFAQNAFYAALQLDANESIREDALFNYAKLTYELAYDPYNSSIGVLTQYISDYPGSERIDEAYMYLTNIFLSTKNYQAAIDGIEEIRIKNNDLRAAYQKITFQRGVQLFNATRYEDAFENFRKSLANNYNAELTARAKYWIAETLYRMGNYTKAIDYYDDFMVAPGAYSLDLYPMTKYNLGYAYFKLKYYDNAVLTFQQFVSRPVKGKEDYVTDAIVRMGDCYFITQNYADAILEYDRAINRKSADSDYALFQKALSEGAMSDNPGKISTLEKLASEFPESSYLDDAYYEIGQSYLLLNQNPEALQWFNKLMTSFPSSSYTVKSLQKSGLIYYNQGDNDKAISTLKQLVNDFPGTTESKEALNTIRNIYIDQNAVSDYYAYAETVSFANVTISEQDSVTYLAAENLYMNNDCRSAILAFGKYKQQFPNGAFILNANYYKAECDLKLGNDEDALDGYNFVLEYPKSRFTENALLRAGKLNYGFENYFESLQNFKKLELVADYQNNITIAMNGQLNCNYRLGNYDEAIQSARKLLERGKLENDQILNAHYIMAKSAMATDNLQLATTEFETTVELSDDEKGAEAKYMLASIQFTLKNYQRAEEMVFELANEYPAYEYWKAKGFIMLADIYAAKDNLFQARQTLQSIIDNYPGDDLKTIAIEKLTIIEIREAENNTNVNDTTGDGQNR